MMRLSLNQFLNLNNSGFMYVQTDTHTHTHIFVTDLFEMMVVVVVTKVDTAYEILSIF